MSAGLFFDQDWFDERLQATGQTRMALAQAAGMSVDEVEMVFRDQRELLGPEVMAFAKVLSVDPGEVANRSGAAELPAGSSMQADQGHGQSLGSAFGSGLGAPRPELMMTREAVTGLHERLDRIERLLELVITKMDRAR